MEEGAMALLTDEHGFITEGTGSNVFVVKNGDVFTPKPHNILRGSQTQIIKQGLNISFTGLITFVKELEKVVLDVPINKIMLETDSPYLTPIPYRGKRNEPYMIKFIAEKISQIKNIPLEEVRNKTTQTAKEFFGI
jgi:hypothetical protein